MVSFFFFFFLCDNLLNRIDSYVNLSTFVNQHFSRVVGSAKDLVDLFRRKREMAGSSVVEDGCVISESDGDDCAVDMDDLSERAAEQ